MTEAYANKAYIALFNLLDSKFDKSKDREVGRLLSDMNQMCIRDRINMM